MNKILVLCIFWLVHFPVSSFPLGEQIGRVQPTMAGWHSRSKDAAPPSNSQIICLKRCHESYCARAKKAFAESERLVFKDTVQSRFEYEQGCINLCKARCVMKQIQMCMYIELLQH